VQLLSRFRTHACTNAVHIHQHAWPHTLQIPVVGFGLHLPLTPEQAAAADQFAAQQAATRELQQKQVRASASGEGRVKQGVKLCVCARLTSCVCVCQAVPAVCACACVRECARLYVCGFACALHAWNSCAIIPCG